jgi:hypothetical protein
MAYHSGTEWQLAEHGAAQWDSRVADVWAERAGGTLLAVEGLGPDAGVQPERLI